MKEMQIDEVTRIYNLLEINKIKIYVDGGWGIDALLGKQTRPHADLDIAVQHKNVTKLRELLKGKGYNEIQRSDTKEYNFVLTDNKGHEVDVHSYTFNEKGNIIYGIAYPKESLTGIGTINNQEVKCIAAEWVIKFHENYKPDEDDRKDIDLLCSKFNLPKPKNY